MTNQEYINLFNFFNLNNTELTYSANILSENTNYFISLHEQNQYEMCFQFDCDEPHVLGTVLEGESFQISLYADSNLRNNEIAFDKNGKHFKIFARRINEDRINQD